MTYRCQGCHDYRRTVYRKLGLGSVCSSECEATVRTRQRGGTNRDRGSTDYRDSYFVEPAPGASDHTSGTQAMPGDTGDFRPSASGGRELPGGLHQRDGIHDSTKEVRDLDHDSKKTLREETLATTASRTARSRDRQHSIRERDRRCRYCGTRNNLDVHHIEYRSQGGNDDPHNLIALCRRHHELVHSDKGLWQPLLRAYIWLLYLENRRLFLLDIKRAYLT